MKTVELVEEFHRVFGHTVADSINIDNRKLNALRVELIREELEELGYALNTNDAIEVLDALTDLQYVLDGAYLALGFSQYKDAAFNEVHRSNMSKLGADGKPIYRADGKILKGVNYSEPNLAKVMGEED